MFFKKIKMKKKDFEPKIQRSYIGYKPYQPIPHFLASIFIPKKSFSYCIRFSFMKYMFYFKYISFEKRFKLNWLTKLPSRLVLVLYS